MSDEGKPSNDTRSLRHRGLPRSGSIFSSQCRQNRHQAFRPMQTFTSSKTRRASLKSQHQNLGGAERDRTADPLLAKQVLSQLSYSPIQVSIPDRYHQTGPEAHVPKGRPVRSEAAKPRQRQDKTMVGPGRLELPTSRLSGVRSNHLSYGPILGRTQPNSGSLSSEERETWAAVSAIPSECQASPRRIAFRWSPDWCHLCSKKRGKGHPVKPASSNSDASLERR